MEIFDSKTKIVKEPFPQWFNEFLDKYIDDMEEDMFGQIDPYDHAVLTFIRYIRKVEKGEIE